MKEIIRTFKTTTVTPVVVGFENGVVTTEELAPVIFTESMSEEKMLKEIRKINPKAVIKEVIEKQEKRAISFEDFMKYSKVIE